MVVALRDCVRLGTSMTALTTCRARIALKKWVGFFLVLQSKPPSPEVRRLRAHVVELARDVEHWQEELGANAAALVQASALSVDNDQLKARVADASRTVDATAAALSRARAADESAANDVALLRSKVGTVLKSREVP